MSHRHRLPRSAGVTGLLVAVALLVGAIGAGSAGAASLTPAWTVTSLATPTNFVPGDTANEYFYDLRVANIGGAATDGSPITITDTLPAGLTVKGIDLELRNSEIVPFNFAPFLMHGRTGAAGGRDLHDPD